MTGAPCSLLESGNVENHNSRAWRNAHRLQRAVLHLDCLIIPNVIQPITVYFRCQVNVDLDLLLPAIEGDYRRRPVQMSLEGKDILLGQDARDADNVFDGLVEDAVFTTGSVRYRIKLDEEAGGHVLNVTDWMYLMENGTIMNRSQFTKFGITVAELVATMRRIPA